MRLSRTLWLLPVCWLAGCYDSLEPTPLPTKRARHDGGAHATSRDAGHAEPDAEPDAAVRDAGDVDGSAQPDAETSGWDPLPTWILENDLENARDIGGVPLRDGASVAHGQIFRGPPLRPLTAAGCDEVASLGIRTVIDLRISTERDSSPESACVLDRTNIVVAPLPVPYGVSPSDYIADLDTFESIARVFDRLGDPAAYPVYFHCTWGRDRTGVVTAVILRALGASRADVMKEYLLSSGSVGAYPASLEAVLEVIEQRGGIESYLAAAGIPREHVDVLRKRVVRSVEHSSED